MISDDPRSRPYDFFSDRGRKDQSVSTVATAVSPVNGQPDDVTSRTTSDMKLLRRVLNNTAPRKVCVIGPRLAYYSTISHCQITPEYDRNSDSALSSPFPPATVTRRCIQSESHDHWFETSLEISSCSDKHLQKPTQTITLAWYLETSTSDACDNKAQKSCLGANNHMSAAGNWRIIVTQKVKGVETKKVLRDFGYKQQRGLTPSHGQQIADTVVSTNSNNFCIQIQEFCHNSKSQPMPTDQNSEPPEFVCDVTVAPVDGLQSIRFDLDVVHADDIYHFTQNIKNNNASKTNDLNSYNNHKSNIYYHRTSTILNINQSIIDLVVNPKL